MLNPIRCSRSTKRLISWLALGSCATVAFVWALSQASPWPADAPDGWGSAVDPVAVTEVEPVAGRLDSAPPERGAVPERVPVRPTKTRLGIVIPPDATRHEFVPTPVQPAATEAAATAGAEPPMAAALAVRRLPADPVAPRARDLVAGVPEHKLDTALREVLDADPAHTGAGHPADTAGR